MRAHLSKNFAALSASPSYRRFMFGQLFSESGLWIQVVALSWLVLQISDSGTVVGLMVACQFFPVVLISPIAGLLTDRVDTRKLLMVAYSLFALHALALATLNMSGVVQLWMLYALAVLFGTTVAIDQPARVALISEVVEKKEFGNAVSLHTVNRNVARLVGPAAAAGIIALWGETACFAVNFATAAVMVIVLGGMRTKYTRPEGSQRQPGQLREGVRYVWNEPQLRVPLLMLFAMGTFVYEFQVVLPVFARFTFGGDASTFGVMTAVMGAGAVVGGVALAGRDRHGTGPLARQTLAFGVLMGLTAIAPTLGFALVAIAFVGAASVVFMSRAITTMQLNADVAFRGRVMGLVTVAFIGTTPIGGPLVGWISEQFGPRWGLGAGAAACFAAAAYGLLSSRQRGDSRSAGDVSPTTEDRPPVAPVVPQAS